MATAVDTYERNQGYNFLTRWLHSYRFRNAIEVLSDFAAHNPAPLKLIEIGAAHGKLFSVLNPLFPLDYTGIELNESYVNVARTRYGAHPNFRVRHENALTGLDHVGSPDVVCALETLEHIPDPIAYRIVEKIAALEPKLFLCSVPIEIGPSILLKNVGSVLCGYVRHRTYRWSETFWAATYQLHRLPPHSTAHKGFDWRWLAGSIRHHFRIREIRRFPLGFMPTALSTSVFMICESR